MIICMRYFLAIVLFLAYLHSSLFSQPTVQGRPSLEQMLNFEAGDDAGAPRGWGGGPRETRFADNKVVHSGKWAARLERDAGSASTFSSLTTGTPIDFAGGRVELRGFLKSEDVSGFFGLWLRQDGESGSVAFDNMQNRQLRGTHDWTQYSITLPLNSDAKNLVFGVLVSGTGRIWADDLQLLVDGKPVWDLSKVERPTTPLDRDHEFDHGSGLGLDRLLPTQIENLATLGKVWGFLKYHHPAVVGGERHWDYDLFRIAPKVILAEDRAAGNAVIREWITTLGPVKDCAPCASLDGTDFYAKPDLGWISDEARLGRELSQDLQLVLKNRPPTGQFYVSLVRAVANPNFQHELGYGAIKLPDSGFQLLALYRLWNMIQYWSPYRDVIGEDWDHVLTEFIPRIALAKTSDAYRREMLALIARIHDTHANLWNSLEVRPPVGNCQLPVVLRFVEKSAVITGYSQAELGPATGLKRGDVIVDLDGTPVRQLVERWTPLYADSNEAARLRDIAASLTRGECGPATLKIRRESGDLTITTSRVPVATLDQLTGHTHDLPGDAFRKLSNDVAYLKLSAAKGLESAHYIESAKDAKGLIIDIRNYPSDFLVFSLGSLLIDKPTEFARFTQGDLANPGAFHWGPSLRLSPMKPHFNGKVVILIDEITQSSAEYHCMAFRVAPGAVVIGSTTAGADGNVSQIPLPGGLRTMISGIGVFYPDKKPTQRIGIVPDIVVTPTLAGIREGRDEVLEAALRQILGPGVPPAAITALARP
jgi:C-terminal processing protease CtpA/Prc